MIGASRALVLSPHTDDAELGCGGAVSRLLRNGCQVDVVVFSRCEDSLPAGDPPDTLELECRRAMDVLGIDRARLSVLDYRVRRFPEARQEILEHLVKVNRSLRPDLVLCPAPGDVHQDHCTVMEEARRAFKHTTLLGYELPWNDSRFSGDLFVGIEEEDLERKQNAVLCYESQMKLYRSYFRPHFLQEWAGLRGLQCGRQYAEAFTVMRVIVQ